MNRVKCLIVLIFKVNRILGKLKFDQNGDIVTEVTYGMYKNGTLGDSRD